MLKHSRMVKTILGAQVLTLTPPNGEAYVVRDIKIFRSGTLYVTVYNGERTAGYFRTSTLYRNHLGFAASVNPADALIWAESAFMDQTVLGLMRSLGIFGGYPVPSGKTFQLACGAAAATVQMVEYDIYDAADILPEMENGPASKSYVMIGYGDTGAVIAAAGDNVYDRSNTPPEFPDFPFDPKVPAGHQIEVFGILGLDVTQYAAALANGISTQYLKIMRGTDCLFDRDLHGLLFRGTPENPVNAAHYVAKGQSQIGDFSNDDRRLPFIFPTPLVMVAGEELNVYLTTTIVGAGANLAVIDQEIGFIMRIKTTGVEAAVSPITPVPTPPAAAILAKPIVAPVAY